MKLRLLTLSLTAAVLLLAGAALGVRSAGVATAQAPVVKRFLFAPYAFAADHYSPDKKAAAKK